MDETTPTRLEALERLAGEVDELARHAPARLAERLGALSVRAQADLALRLAPRQRMEVLLHAPKAMRLVRALPASDWYLTVREIGPSDAGPLVRLASAEQLIHLFDLESWRDDRFDAGRAGAWLALALEAGEPPLRRFLKDADETLLALLLRAWLRVQPLEYEDGAEVHGHGLGDTGTAAGPTTPDGYHRFSPTIPEHTAAAHRILQIFYVDQPHRYERAMWAASWELPGELEEEAYRWRCLRLEEHGFPPLEEAIDVYAAPQGAAAGNVGVPAPRDRDGLAASRRSLMPAWGPRALARATDLLDFEQRERVLFETAAVANRLLVADRADPGEPEHHRIALAKAAGYLTIAFEARGAVRPEDVSAVFRERSVLELFREGYARAAEMQRAARDLVARGWEIAHPDPVAALDAPLDVRLRALLEKRPAYVALDDETNPGLQRDFRSLAEIEETRVAVEMADRVGTMLFRDLGWEPGPGDDPHKLATLWLTSLAGHELDATVGAQRLDSRAVSDFLRNVAARRTAPPEAAERALERWLQGLTAHLGLDPRDVSIARAFGRFANERLADECGALDPGAPPDPRFLPCLLME